MKQRGYDPVTYTDPMKGIDLVRQGKADIVFVDYKMPSMSGVEVIRRIREFNKTIPVVIVTAYLNDVMLHEVAELNISGMFPKRGEFEELEDVLKVILQLLKKQKGQP